MSAFIVDAGHIDYLVAAVRHYRMTSASGTPATPAATTATRPTGWGGDTTDLYYMSETELGRELLRENLASVAHRYGEDLSPDELGSPEAYEYRATKLALSPVQILKAAQCLEYQSCEHPDWADSLACNILARLTSEATRRLPGMDSALWAISRQSLPEALRS